MINLAASLGRLQREIRPFHGEREYVIFGSTSLVLRGILDREPGDVDVHLSRRLWGALLANEEWFVETPKAGDPPILSNEQSPIPIHGFYAWSDPAVRMNVPDLIARAEVVKVYGMPWRVVPVQDALEHKIHALTKGSGAVQKHIPDIEIIEEWLKNNA